MNSENLRLNLRTTIAAWLGFACCVPAVEAQLPDRPLPDTIGRTVTQSGLSTGVIPPEFLMDAPVSRTGYRLGPGDRLAISIFGQVSFLHQVTVTPEGSVVIPAMGVVHVLHLNLNEAEARTRELVTRYYRGVDVSLSLMQVRTFKVFVVGDVAAPGMRIASTTTRVNEVVPSAGENAVGRRNILLRRSSGDTVMVDLVRFLQTGDLSANPTLMEGDAIIVPALDQTVTVFGNVAFPGTYEFRSGESLADLLRVANAGGDLPHAAADSIRVTRFVDDQRRDFLVFSRADATGQLGQSFLLQPYDAVYIPTTVNFREQRTATVAGQVARPGTYPIRPDTTTVRDLVAMAGGLTAEASLSTATLRRSNSQRVTRAQRELQTTPPEFLSPSERQIARISADADDANVVIDFMQLFREGAVVYDHPLQEGDLLTIPRRRDEVMVLGAVSHPGIVRYSPGASPEDYIALAGGFTRRADRAGAVVLRARQGSRVDLREVSVLDPGDQVIVPLRERRSAIEILQTTGNIVTTITGVIFAVLAIKNM